MNRWISLMQYKKNFFTLSHIAEVTESSLHGDPNYKIYQISSLRNAQAGEISFFNNSRYLDDLSNTKASAIILPLNYLDKCPTQALVNQNPLVLVLFYQSFF